MSRLRPVTTAAACVALAAAAVPASAASPSPSAWLKAAGLLSIHASTAVEQPYQTHRGRVGRARMAAKRGARSRREMRRAGARGRVLGRSALASAVARKRAVAARRTTTRQVYCLGDPGYGKAGFLYGGTSTKWLAQFGQAPTPRASMVSFDKTVDVMRAVGCETVKAEIRPDDPTTDNGTAQRAQLFSYDEKQGEGGRATFGVRRGDTWYYGFAFSTNDGYRPQGSSTWPDWNNVFIWHGTNGAPACGIALTVATKRNLGGIGYTPFADGKPHLALDIWGNSAADPRRVQEWHFYDPKPFEAGRRYRVAMKVLWGDSNTGGIQWWVDGRSLTDWVPGISNMAAGFGLYPIFQNYRPANSRINNAISWTNSVYYGGLVRGSSLRDVSIP